MLTPAVLRKAEVAELLGLTERTIDRLERNGSFPKKIQLGARFVGWRYSEVMEWIESRPNSKNFKYSKDSH